LNKSDLRRRLLKQRRSLSPQLWQQKSERLCHNLQSLSLFQEATTILTYMTVHQEPDLSLLWQQKKLHIFQEINPVSDNFDPPLKRELEIPEKNRRWGLSRCLGKTLSWHLWSPGDRLEIGVYNIPEPTGDAPILSPTEVDLILVPAIACDFQGYRLGYGGGFYDRMLAASEWSLVPTIGIVFDFAHLPQLPVDLWDQKLTQVCTD
jgi:5-formyltetrahydrofolate cyclo-ligase